MAGKKTKIETHEKKSMIFHVRLHFPLDAHDEFILFSISRELLFVVEISIVYGIIVERDFKMKEKKKCEIFASVSQNFSFFNSTIIEYRYHHSCAHLHSQKRGRIWFLFSSFVVSMMIFSNIIFSIKI